MIAFELPPAVQTASIGIPDTMFLMVLALIVFGPRRLPEIGRQIGKLMYEFRKVSNDFKFQMEEELRASEEAERQQKLTAAATSSPSPSVPLMIEAPVQAAGPSDLGSNAGVDSLEEPTLAQPLGAGSTDSDPHYSEPHSEPSESMLVEPGPAIEQAGEPAISAAIPGDVRGEPRKFPPTVLPPSGGEPVAAARPFRVKSESLGENPDHLVLEAGTESGANHAEPVSTLDRGQELDALVTETEREARHA